MPQNPMMTPVVPIKHPFHPWPDYKWRRHLLFRTSFVKRQTVYDITQDRVFAADIRLIIRFFPRRAYPVMGWWSRVLVWQWCTDVTPS